MGAQEQIVTLQTHPYQSSSFLIPSSAIGEHLLSPNLQIFMTRKCSISPSSPESGSSSSHSNCGCTRKLSLGWAFKQIVQRGGSEFPLKCGPGTQLNPLRNPALGSIKHLNRPSKLIQVISIFLSGFSPDLFQTPLLGVRKNRAWQVWGASRAPKCRLVYVAQINQCIQIKFLIASNISSDCWISPSLQLLVSPETSTLLSHLWPPCAIFWLSLSQQGSQTWRIPSVGTKKDCTSSHCRSPRHYWQSRVLDTHIYFWDEDWKPKWMECQCFGAGNSCGFPAPTAALTDWGGILSTPALASYTKQLKLFKLCWRPIKSRRATS